MSSVVRYPAALVGCAIFAGTAEAGAGQGVAPPLLVLGVCCVLMFTLPLALCLIVHRLTARRGAKSPRRTFQ